MSVIHVNRDWMQCTGGNIEVAVLSADTTDPKILHLEAIVLDRSGELCYRISAVDLRFKLAEGHSTEEALARIAEENPTETIILDSGQLVGEAMLSRRTLERLLLQRRRQSQKN